MPSKPRIYLETSVISYPTARPSGNALNLQRQRLTRKFWQTRLRDFDAYVSLAVVLEASLGDPSAARLRFTEIERFPALLSHPGAELLAEAYVSGKLLPVGERGDATHIALASFHELGLSCELEHAPLGQSEHLAKT